MNNNFNNTQYKPKVLLVDPNIALYEIISELLSEKMHVNYAPSAKEALILNKKENFDLLISEIELPDEDALDFIKIIKENSPNIMVVVTTEKATVEKAVSAVRLGTLDFIQKPFTIEELAVLIDRFFALTSNKQSDYDLLANLLEEKRMFILPTKLDMVNTFVNEIIDVVKRLSNMDKKTTLGMRLAIYEMIFNAMEHGNLGITYEEKKELLETQPNYLEYLKKRALEPQYKDKKVIFTYIYEKNKISFIIEDEGTGFDVSTIPSLKEELNDGLHGRGIFLSKVNMTNIEYNEKGNKVTITKILPSTP
ncbi:MAG: response regulator [Spirochaetia bacterium]|nr:response regulator [Spirochaetia bacterium]